MVHNGDFANYHAVGEYLKQNNIFPQFLTDTEVSVLMLDLLNRTYRYPMEYIIEAMAPTTEHDFDMLPADRQKIYRQIQSNHLQSSPDGPWFFIIARNDFYNEALQLIGITDTAMLRPQVFALQEGDVQIGLLCSEKQAIDATLQSLASEDSRFCPVADTYWNARGGSANDGGAFMFTVKDAGKGDGSKTLVCTNKFGQVVSTPKHQYHCDMSLSIAEPEDSEKIRAALTNALNAGSGADLAATLQDRLNTWDYNALRYALSELVQCAGQSDDAKSVVIDALTLINDRRYDTGDKKRSAVLAIVRSSLTAVFAAMPGLDQKPSGRYGHIDRTTRDTLRAPAGSEQVLVIDASDFEPEGDDCDSLVLTAAYKLGWRQFICYGYKGQRFTGCGFGPQSDGVRIDVYDSSGDYLASGIDGLEITVHNSAQDQLGQIMKRGKLVVHGDVGQTFMYGAKGGEVYVLGSAAGRPLINAVGHPRVVINGTCLDYLAESFMAGDALNGGGFVVVNGLGHDNQGKVFALESPYPGANLFSLASGGAIYIRDPHKKVVNEQLNGGEIVDLCPADWELIAPYLEENQRLFDISIENDLLTVDGEKQDYTQVYRKVRPSKLEVLAVESVVSEEYGVDWEQD